MEHWREMSHQYQVTVWIKVGNQRAVTSFAKLEKRWNCFRKWKHHQFERSWAWTKWRKWKHHEFEQSWAWTKWRKWKQYRMWQHFRQNAFGNIGKNLLLCTSPVQQHISWPCLLPFSKFCCCHPTFQCLQKKKQWDSSPDLMSMVILFSPRISVSQGKSMWM